ncbi:MAG: hypothetical protein E6H83_01670 [Chloroflexi bacterium]|nr:MAG: hypothetical protein E6H83_01670 [Chloroflexota bacterium]
MRRTAIEAGKTFSSNFSERISAASRWDRKNDKAMNVRVPMPAMLSENRTLIARGASGLADCLAALSRTAAIARSPKNAANQIGVSRAGLSSSEPSGAANAQTTTALA